MWGMELVCMNKVNNFVTHKEKLVIGASQFQRVSPFAL
jgi:hypothetical protein